MRKILALFLAFTMLLPLTLLLTSCKEGDEDLPENMQLVAGGDELGYYFYGPEEWVVANQGNIKATYVSSTNYTSVTFTETDINYTSLGDGDNPYRSGVKKAFDASALGYLSEPFSEYSLITSDEPCSFGNASEAYKYIFSYVYEDKPYTCMQIFVKHQDVSYVFTYNASSQEYSEEDGSFYSFYLNNKVKPIMDNFLFVEKKGDLTADKYESDGQGNILASEKTKCGFKLWVPESYKVDYSSAAVSVTKNGGGNITVCKLINNSISIKDNYIQRRELLSAIADKKTDADGNLQTTFNEIKGIIKNEDGSETMHLVDLPRARSAAELEYTYVLDGKTYHVYQVFAVKGYFSVQVYVFTFTCEEKFYAGEIDSVMEILMKMEY